MSVENLFELLKSGGGWAVATVLMWWIYRKDIESARIRHEHDETYISLLKQSIALMQQLALSMEEWKDVIKKCHQSSASVDDGTLDRRARNEGGK